VDSIFAFAIVCILALPFLPGTLIQWSLYGVGWHKTRNPVWLVWFGSPYIWHLPLAFISANVVRAALLSHWIGSLQYHSITLGAVAGTLSSLTIAAPFLFAGPADFGSSLSSAPLVGALGGAIIWLFHSTDLDRLKNRFFIYLLFMARLGTVISVVGVVILAEFSVDVAI
jgi:hypothetical protein